MMYRFGFAAMVVMTCAILGCGTGDTAPAIDAAPADAQLAKNGCLVLSSPQAAPGDDLGGDTYATFASGFFSTYCTKCHSSTATDRHGAPPGLNWDVEATVRDNLSRIRNAVGVGNFMPPAAETQPSCEDRLRLVRWIDADAP